jgi:hypothetical protein
LTSAVRAEEALLEREVMAPFKLESALWKALTTSVKLSRAAPSTLLRTLSMRVPRACSAATAREFSEEIADVRLLVSVARAAAVA